MALIVIKIGGGAELLTSESQANFCRNVAVLAKAGNQIVIVNGANSLLTKVQEERGITPRMITSERGEKSRYTDAETITLLKEVYGGVNQTIAKLINELDAKAEGYFCAEHNLLIAERHGKQRIVEDGKVKIIDGDLTGKITEVNTEFIQQKLEAGIVLVLTPPAITADGIEVNVDGDKVASSIAVALRADKLIFLSNTAGLLRDVADPASAITEIKIAEADQYAEGRMKKKVLSAKRAVEAGVAEVMFADGRRATPLTDALNGIGTKVR
jgi:acetylglutamate/LysW-gamma-L-alpha-aminoadipate kinase